jgi:hypothetical protein
MFNPESSITIGAKVEISPKGFTLEVKAEIEKITLEPCPLNAEYQHFILRFIKMSLLCGYH